MHALIVVSHPDPGSLTHAVAHGVAGGIAISGPHTTEFADLAAEGFHPAFHAGDREAYLLKGDVPADVLHEQARIDHADALVLVFPVYWWSFPGQLKGWIDRVFTNGWAYDEAPDGSLGQRLGRLAVHLVGIGGADGGTCTRDGYDGAMRTQIDHGIFGFCGAQVLTSELLMGTNGAAATAHLATARALGARVFRKGPATAEPRETRSPAEQAAAN